MQDDVKDNATVTGVQPLYNPVPIYSDDGSHIATSKAPVCLQFKIASDETLKQVVDSGVIYTSSDVDYTVKVEAQHLRPFATYYYQFNICGSDRVSPLGRTKTAPAATDEVSEISLAVYSCSNFRKLSLIVSNELLFITTQAFGFFNAYGNPANKDSVDYVLHLGDFSKYFLKE